jgi:hypothetical protein
MKPVTPVADKKSNRPANSGKVLQNPQPPGIVKN